MSDPLMLACRQFEAVLLKQALLESGFGKRIHLADDTEADDASTADAVFGSNPPDSDIMQSLLADTMAQTIASADRSGFSRSLAAQLEKAKS